MAKSKQIHQLTIIEWEALFPDEDACRAYLVKNRWPNGVYCPRCGSTKAYPITQAWKWECPDCAKGNAYRFSHIAGTIFENTNYPLRTWFRVIHMMLTAKKGVSALQVHRTIGTGSYRTAWYMCHRIRGGLGDRDFQQLIGVVEADETYIGGKTKNKHKGKRGGDDGNGPGGGAVGKAIVAGAISRKGNIVARVIEHADRATLEHFLAQTVSHKVSLIVTDDNRAYQRLSKTYPHAVVKHSVGNYVNGVFHTNTIEGFWSILKRGVIGTFHKVSKKYLPLYVAEFQFRYNNRLNPDIFGTAIKGC